MAENVYEGMFILDANRYGRDPEAVSGQIAKIIEEAGGEILTSRLWEERRLAYPIKGQRRGVYWLTYFRVNGERVTELERQSQLSESILRVLFLKVDPRIVDALVAHAESGHIGSEPSPEEEEADKGEAVAVAENGDAEAPDPDDED